MAMVYRRYCLRDLNCFLLLVPHLFLSLFPCESVAAVDVPSSLPPNKTQEAIMMNLSSAVGDSWGFSTNMCDWDGVACSRSRSGSSMVVTNITLSDYGMSNTSIFASLCLLDTLLSLDLSGNFFTNLGDKFSTTSCRMKEGLLSLNLSHNQLSHRLSEFSGFSRLEVLDLSFNILTAENLSTDLGSFHKLRSLNLSSNKLNGAVPVSIASSLVELVLSDNQLNDTIPPGLFKYGNLTLLDLGQNNFTGPIPSSITSHVRMLNLSNNNLHGEISPNFLSHMGLQTVDLTSNMLEGTIPSHLSPSLYGLRLGGNRLSGNISASICDGMGLIYLDLDDNQLTGNIPSELSKCKSLTSLNLASNKFQGPVPVAISSLEKLVVLNLQNNSISGPIPDTFSDIRSLTTLILSHNHLSGSIPSDLGFSSELAILDLSYNNLSGEVPSSLAYVGEVSYNNLSGEVSYNNHLKMLDLSYNNLSGKIPPDLLSHMGLHTVDLTNNILEGTIPSHLSQSLYRLRLGGNRLRGNISHSICDGMGLAYLELDDNQLTGYIPSELSKCKSLTLLNLASNKLHGPVPAAISSLNELVILKLQNNSISGPIPDTFSDIRSLTTLILSHNHLSGSIPSDLGSSSELAILDLSYNNLSGEVPSSLWNLQSLTQLVLSYNNLSGFVPRLRQNVAIDIDGNPDLVTRTGDNNYTPSHSTRKRRALIVVVTIFATASALGLCFFLVIAMISSPKRTYHVDNVRIPPGEDDSQITNGGLIAMNCFRTSAIMFMKEKQDEWRITAFQALNFEAADILQGLTEENLVGSGGSGQVYRVTYTNRYNRSIGVVAVKQIRSFGSLDELLEHEFESEASILCNIRHNNIVKLLCCLSGADSKLLVYDYMDNGSLDRWLHGDYVLRAGHPMAKARPVQRVPLDWPTRLIVAVGAAQGLCYMHHHCSPPIIHRDVKTSNILLDSEFRAKVADFGLARMLMQAGEPNTMTWVVGSFGYMAPEYAYTRKVNEKVDVFGFGVVLLELTTDKNANDGGDHGSLAEWAGHHYRSGASIPDATDICIRYAGYADEIETVFRLGVKCTANSPSSRPTMKDVLQILLKCSEQMLRKSRLECSTE